MAPPAIARGAEVRTYPAAPAAVVPAPVEQPNAPTLLPKAAAALVVPAPAVPSPAAMRENGSIGLVLPLQSTSYGRAAEAVRDGFLAAARAAHRESGVHVFGHGDDGVLPAIDEAARRGASLIVGPLVRDDVKAAIALDISGERFLVLNHLDDGAPLPSNVYALSLAIESDAAQLARVASEDGVHALASVTNDSPLQRRFHDAFAALWAKESTLALRDYRFSASPDMLQLLRHELAARGVDGVLLAVDGADAISAKAFLPQVPVYASSQMVDDQPALTARELDNVRYIEIPWLATPDRTTFGGIARPAFASNVLARLYALGIDAFGVAELLAEGGAPQQLDYDGATGHLSLLPSHLFAREGEPMIIRDGVAVPYVPGR